MFGGVDSCGVHRTTGEEDKKSLGRCRPGLYSSGFKVKAIVLVPAAALVVQGIFFVSSRASRLYSCLYFYSQGCRGRTERMMVRLVYSES